MEQSEFAVILRQVLEALAYAQANGGVDRNWENPVFAGEGGQLDPVPLGHIRVR
jgi:hypothetical protein